MEKKVNHQCEVLAINCMDFRLQSAVHDYLVSQGYKYKYDLISDAGSLKDLVEGDKVGAEKLLKDINVSYELHKVRKFIIIHHMDCGAYGGHDAFENLKVEKDQQIKAMKKAADIISRKFIYVEIQLILARIDESGEIPEIDFEVIS